MILTFALALFFFGHPHDSAWRRETGVGDPFPPTITGEGDPIDGDSLWVGNDEVRLKGIDAPEWRQDCEKDAASWKCGQAAREELVRSIARDDVTCTIKERDVYGRMLGHCTAGGRDLNAGMVASGMAVAFGSYWDEQAMARAERRGLWAGRFEIPRDWRREHASEEER